MRNLTPDMIRHGIDPQALDATQLATDALLRHDHQVVVGGHYLYRGRLVILTMNVDGCLYHAAPLGDDAQTLYHVEPRDLEPVLRPHSVAIGVELARALRKDLTELVNATFAQDPTDPTHHVSVVAARDWPAARELLMVLRDV